ncbi:MAG: adenylate/guanylate cyclase domain-containing protein [Cyanobacteria bacterium]|nr:adenylate/guanylate cyclase domain-containing protein [Cyanobacteriota bacterium]MDW8200268.1 adenylate/guanylate cyclase domain-containing protein [Cyanobacteriota bacterium SKYGB_h_bin112]
MNLTFFRQLQSNKLTRQLSKLDWFGLVVVATSTAAIAGLVLGIRHLGLFQPLELKVYDQMVRARPNLGQDPCVLIVAITEDDIKRYGTTLTDEVMATALERLQHYEPAAIGVDIYRDLPQPPGTAKLAKQFTASNVIAITKLPSAEDPIGIPAPAAISPSQVGFNDVVTDPDGVVRRSVLEVKLHETSVYSFALQLALLHLGQQNLFPRQDESRPDRVTWGKATFQSLKPNSGAYQNIDSAGYQILLNYRAAQRSIPQVTLTQLMHRQVNPEAVRGKIILIGNTSISTKDSFFTPYSAAAKEGVKMYGVEIHAQMVSQFLDAVSGKRPPFWFWPEWLEILWICGTALVGGVLAWQLRNPLFLTLGGLASVGVIVGIGYGSFIHHSWIPIVAPALATILTSSVVITYRAQQAQRQQQMVMTLLGQNTSPEIANALWDSRASLLEAGMLPGQAMTATMLFTDIKDFSTISEQMAPQELLVWLNEYLSAMTQEIQAQHGIVNKFIGDGVMAIFGVPIPRVKKEEIAEDARRAVNAALAMGERLKLLNKDWAARKLPTVNIRAGIYTGLVVAGSIGGKERMEYGVIGDSVNIASRLESCAKDRQEDTCRILIAQETYDYIQGEYDVQPWGPMSLKGKHKEVNVYRVLKRSEPSSPLLSDVIPTMPAPLVSSERLDSDTDIRPSLPM